MEHWTLVAGNCSSPMHHECLPPTPWSWMFIWWHGYAIEFDDNAHDILFRTRNVVDVVPGDFFWSEIIPHAGLCSGANVSEHSAGESALRQLVVCVFSNPAFLKHTVQSMKIQPQTGVFHTWVLVSLLCFTSPKNLLKSHKCAIWLWWFWWQEIHRN